MSKKYIFTRIWFFLLVFASAISIASNIDNSNEVPIDTLHSLERGLDYHGLWTRQERFDWSEKHFHKIITNNDLNFIETSGFKSLRMMFALEPLFFPNCTSLSDKKDKARKCAENEVQVKNKAQNIIDNQGIASDNGLSEVRYNQLIKQIRRTIDNSNLYLVITPNDRNRRKGKHGKSWGEATGVIFFDMVESDLMVDAYKSLWKRLAIDLQDIPSSRLGFELMNEPQFCYQGMKIFQPKRWKKIATELTDIIREVSPDRTVFISGVCKGLVVRKNKNGSFSYPIDNLGIPIDRKNIVYVYHSYGDSKFAHQPLRKKQEYVKVDDSKFSDFDDGIERIAEWRERNNVPVWLNEFGANSSPKSHKFHNEVSKEREKYVRKSVEILDKYKVPFAWASFGIDRTLFKNETRKYGIEKLRQPDCGLLESMGLKCKTSYEASNP